MQEEYFSTVTATVKITIRSDEPLDAAMVDEFLSETSYEFGDEYGLTVGPAAKEATCYVAATEWTDNSILNLNKEDPNA